MLCTALGPDSPSVVASCCSFPLCETCQALGCSGCHAQRWERAHLPHPSGLQAGGFQLDLQGPVPPKWCSFCRLALSWRKLGLHRPHFIANRADCGTTTLDLAFSPAMFLFRFSDSFLSCTSTCTCPIHIITTLYSLTYSLAPRRASALVTLLFPHMSW